MQSTPSDIDHLLSRVLERDDYAAFEKLFYIYYNPLRSFSKKLVRINEVAEELVSEFFTKVWTHRKCIVISSSAKAYLYTAVRNRSFDHLRKEKRASWTNLEEAAAIACDNVGAEQYAELNELQMAIDKAVAQLPKQCRLIFQMSRDQGLKYQEIADSLHLSVKTIETQMGRALKVLRVKLQEEQLPSQRSNGNIAGRLKTSNTNLTA